MPPSVEPTGHSHQLCYEGVCGGIVGVYAGSERCKTRMVDIFSFIFDVLAHRIGVRVLKLFSGGQFEGESGCAWGWAEVVGGLVLLAPFAAFITWLIYANQG